MILFLCSSADEIADRTGPCRPGPLGPALVLVRHCKRMLVAKPDAATPARPPAPMLVVSVSGIWLECSDEYSTSTVMSVWASVAFRNLGGLFFFSVDAPTSCP